MKPILWDAISPAAKRVRNENRKLKEGHATSPESNKKRKKHTSSRKNKNISRNERKENEENNNLADLFYFCFYLTIFESRKEIRNKK